MPTSQTSRQQSNLAYARSIAPTRYVTRGIRLIEADYRLCRLCGLVRNIGRDICPPFLRSEHEDELIRCETISSLVEHGRRNLDSRRNA